MKFAGSGGIILTFKRGSSAVVESTMNGNTTHIKSTAPARFLDVSWLSAFPEEKERLFYGQNVVFEIADIYESSTGKTYADTLTRFNIFQKMVKNSDINWLTIGEDSPYIMKLISLICKQIVKREDDIERQFEKEQKKNDGDDKKQDNDSDDRDDEDKRSDSDSDESYDDMVEYDERLFNHFCNFSNENNEWIAIRSYVSIPLALRQSFITKGNEKKVLDFSKISKLFPYIKRLVLNELDINEMDEEIKNYEISMGEFIKLLKANKQKYKRHLCNLREIILESKHERNGKVCCPNLILVYFCPHFFDFTNRLIQHWRSERIKSIRNSRKRGGKQRCLMNLDWREVIN